MKTSARKRGYTSPLKIYIYIAISSKNTRLEGTNHITYHTLIQKKCQKINCQQKCIHKFIPTHLYAATEIQPISTPKILPLHNRAPGQCPCERPRPGSWDPAGPQRFCCRSQKKQWIPRDFWYFWQSGKINFWQSDISGFLILFGVQDLVQSGSTQEEIGWTWPTCVAGATLGYQAKSQPCK